MESECRTCLKISDNLLDLYVDDLPLKIKTISAVQISENDRFPSKICKECVENVHLLYEFRRILIRSDEILQQRLVVKVESYIEENALDDTQQEEATKLEPKVEFITEDSWVLSETEGGQDCGNKSSSDVYNCNHCDFTTSVRDLWKNHKKSKSHTGVEKSICNYCGKLITKYNLSKHLLTHTEAPVLCKFCGKQFKNWGSLRGHLLNHKGIRHQCAVCGRIYTNRKSYSDHIKRHKLGDVKTVKCLTCGKLFYDKKTLVKHIRSHTGERPYPCEYCKKGFSSNNALKTHIRQHTNEKPYNCDYCDMAYTQKVSLRTHLRSKHSDKIAEQP